MSYGCAKLVEDQLHMVELMAAFSVVLFGVFHFPERHYPESFGKNTSKFQIEQYASSFRYHHFNNDKVQSVENLVAPRRLAQGCALQ